MTNRRKSCASKESHENITTPNRATGKHLNIPKHSDRSSLCGGSTEKATNSCFLPDNCYTHAHVLEVSEIQPIANRQAANSAQTHQIAAYDRRIRPKRSATVELQPVIAQTSLARSSAAQRESAEHRLRSQTTGHRPRQPPTVLPSWFSVRTQEP